VKKKVNPKERGEIWEARKGRFGQAMERKRWRGKSGKHRQCPHKAKGEARDCIVCMSDGVAGGGTRTVSRKGMAHLSPFLTHVLVMLKQCMQCHAETLLAENTQRERGGKRPEDESLARWSEVMRLDVDALWTEMTRTPKFSTFQELRPPCGCCTTFVEWLWHANEQVNPLVLSFNVLALQRACVPPPSTHHLLLQVRNAWVSRSNAHLYCLTQYSPLTAAGSQCMGRFFRIFVALSREP